MMKKLAIFATIEVQPELPSMAGVPFQFAGS